MLGNTQGSNLYKPERNVAAIIMKGAVKKSKHSYTLNIIIQLLFK